MPNWRKRGYPEVSGTNLVKRTSLFARHGYVTGFQESLAVAFGDLSRANPGRTFIAIAPASRDHCGGFGMGGAEDPVRELQQLNVAIKLCDAGALTLDFGDDGELPDHARVVTEDGRIVERQAA